MENGNKSKYDIPLVVIDTRNQSNNFKKEEQGLRHLKNAESQALPDLETLMKFLLVSIQRPLIALKYRFFKYLDKFFEDVEIPWLKIIALGLVAFMAFKKDIQFNMSFNAPQEGIVDEQKNNRSLVKGTTFGAAGNPYAPISANSLEDKRALDFIKQYASVAQTEMKLYGIPASIKMAQALIESRAGSSRLATKNNNHFGIKCFSRNCKKGHCTNATDDHHKDFFRKYGTEKDSWRAHSTLLQGNRYKSLQNHGTDYKKWAHGLKKAGYATDKRYAEKLINTIEKYRLYRLDALN